METLTKENFWDEMAQKYPKAMEHFLAWVDQYKKDNRWHKIFQVTATPPGTFQVYVKYHELPTAIQFGIFLEWYWSLDVKFKPPLSMKYWNPGTDIQGVLLFINVVGKENDLWE